MLRCNQALSGLNLSSRSAPNGYTLSRERHRMPARFVFDVLAPLVGFSVGLVGRRLALRLLV